VNPRRIFSAAKQSDLQVVWQVGPNSKHTMRLTVRLEEYWPQSRTLPLHDAASLNQRNKHLDQRRYYIGFAIHAGRVRSTLRFEMPHGFFSSKSSTNRITSRSLPAKLPQTRVYSA
jgi:hypothetical protein